MTNKKTEMAEAPNPIVDQAKASLSLAITHLAEARRDVEFYAMHRDELARRRELVLSEAGLQEPTELNLEAVEEAKRDERRAYEAVVRAASHVHEITGDKHPHAVITIRESEVVEYSEYYAWSWCVSYCQSALKLDRKVFDKAMLLLRDHAAGRLPAGVNFVAQAKPTVRRDLSGYVPPPDKIPGDAADVTFQTAAESMPGPWTVGDTVIEDIED